MKSCTKAIGNSPAEIERWRADRRKNFPRTVPAVAEFVAESVVEAESVAEPVTSSLLHGLTDVMQANGWSLVSADVTQSVIKPEIAKPEIAKPITTPLIFPVPESSTLEFKETCNAANAPKLFPTLCGILNAGGGHMVIGVRDYDLAIVGIHSRSKDYDKLLLRIDTAWHSKLIRNQSGSPLPRNTFTTQLVVNGDKTLLVICITAPRDGGIFETDGVVWHRLNASNYAEHSDSEFTMQTKILQTKHALELDALRRRIDLELGHRTRLTQDYRVMIAAAQKMEVERMGLRAEIKRLKDAEASLKDAAAIRDLFESILAQKAEAEAKLASKPASLFCGLW